MMMHFIRLILQILKVYVDAAYIKVRTEVQVKQYKLPHFL